MSVFVLPPKVDTNLKPEEGLKDLGWILTNKTIYRLRLHHKIKRLDVQISGIDKKLNLHSKNRSMASWTHKLRLRREQLVKKKQSIKSEIDILLVLMRQKINS